MTLEGRKDSGKLSECNEYKDAKSFLCSPVQRLHYNEADIIKEKRDIQKSIFKTRPLSAMPTRRRRVRGMLLIIIMLRIKVKIRYVYISRYL